MAPVCSARTAGRASSGRVSGVMDGPSLKGVGGRGRGARLQRASSLRHVANVPHGHGIAGTFTDYARTGHRFKEVAPKAPPGARRAALWYNRRGVRDASGGTVMARRFGVGRFLN